MSRSGEGSSSLRGPTPGTSPRRSGGFRGGWILCALLLYLAASQGPVVAEMAHGADHLLRSSSRTLRMAPGEPHRHTHDRRAEGASPADHSHGVLLDGILAAAREAGERDEPAMAPVVPLHLPGAPPALGVALAGPATPPGLPPPFPFPAPAAIPPTPPPRG